MRILMVAFTAVGIGVLAVGCSGGQQHPAASTNAPTTTTKAAPPVTEAALKGFLLSPEEVNAAMGTTEMTVTRSHVGLSDDSDTMEPRDCLAVDGAAQAQVYAGSGFTGVRDQSLQLQEGENFTHYAEQAVVLFSSAKQADAFFDASVKQWPTCREYKHIQSGTEWEAEPASNTNGVLSTVATQENAGSPGWACGRALTARNNIVVDVNTCSADPGGSAVEITNQIAARVPNKAPEPEGER